MTSSSKGGPRTQQGKFVSSRNAIKVGLYTNTLLEGEDEQQLLKLQEALLDEWQLHSPQAQILARDYIYSDLKSARVMQAKVALLDAQMAMQETRRQFAQEAGISVLYRDQLPDWYFGQDSSRMATAVERANAVQEALTLKENYSLNDSLQARTLYPSLWRVVMGPHAINPQQTLGEKLLSHFGKSTPQANLQAFAEHFQEKFVFDLIWGENAVRYGQVLSGLRAKLSLEVFSRADWVKVENFHHRKRMEILHMVHALRKEQALTLEVSSLQTSSVSLISQADAQDDSPDP